jgi:hypothetical protein
LSPVNSLNTDDDVVDDTEVNTMESKRQESRGSVGVEEHDMYREKILETWEALRLLV